LVVLPEISGLEASIEAVGDTTSMLVFSGRVLRLPRKEPVTLRRLPIGEVPIGDPWAIGEPWGLMEIPGSSKFPGSMPREDPTEPSPDISGGSLTD